MSKNVFRKKPIGKILEDTAQDADFPEHGGMGLSKVLGVKDLTFIGIAAVIGAGIFSTIGTAAFHGGPGVSLLFVITAVTCGFSALCYAEFASRIPISGSAYTYAYASFGELIAWIIGWDLLLEYAIGNIAVAISWSQYFTNLLEGFNIHIPTYFTMDFLSAHRGYDTVVGLMKSGMESEITPALMEAYNAWSQAPSILGLKIIGDLPALLIVFIISVLVYIGIRETKKATNYMVIFKILVVILVIVIGFFYVTPANWHPFLPNGFEGMMKGVSGVFFAYIGFDAISTTAEECKNPQRDLPKSMIYSLIFCTVLYILIALVLTGMVSYKELQVGDPLAFVFEKVGLTKISYVISISAVVATASVLLVFQMGQPRIWMSMSRDGLLPKKFASIHPKFKTPAFATIVTGFLVAIPALFMNLTEVTDLTSIGTLFAFVLVCAGVLVLPKESAEEVLQPRFRIPYFNGRYILPVLLIVIVYFGADFFLNKISFHDKESFKHAAPYILFVIVITVISILTIWKQLSIIPVMGLLSCLYLMTELGYTNWIRFLVWLFIGLVIYFFYSYNNSKLNTKNA